MIRSPARKIGPYELLSRCGEGGFGEVWLARGLDGKQVALKIIGTAFRGKSWESELKGVRFYQQKVPHHPNLLEIFHVAREENFLYYTMEAADSVSPEKYIPLTLAEKIRIEPLPVAEVKTVLLALLDGLETLHRAGLVHRDIKPENILYVNGIPKLADISLVRDPALTVSRSGTPGFCPPEKDNQGSPADDCYALCMVGYCAATGLSPVDFPKKPLNLTLKDYAAIREVFIRGCNSDAAMRFQSTAELRKYLQSGKIHRRKPVLLLSLAVLSVLFLVLAMLWKKEENIPSPVPRKDAPQTVSVTADKHLAEIRAADKAKSTASKVGATASKQIFEAKAKLASLREKQDRQLTELIQNAQTIYQNSLASDEETIQDWERKGVLDPVQKKQLETHRNECREMLRKIAEILPLPFEERQRAWKEFRENRKNP